MKYFKFGSIMFLFILSCIYEENLNSHLDNGRLVINEFMVRNSEASGVFDEDSLYNDWIELFNISSDTIYLGDYFLSDQLGNLYKYQLPQSYILPGEFFLVWGGDSDNSPDNHLGFNFSADTLKNEMILLSNFIGEVIDSFRYINNDDALDNKKSFGRKPDGAINWTLLELATPGSKNIQ